MSLRCSGSLNATPFRCSADWDPSPEHLGAGVAASPLQMGGVSVSVPVEPTNNISESVIERFLKCFSRSNATTLECLTCAVGLCLLHCPLLFWWKYSVGFLHWSAEL